MKNRSTWAGHIGAMGKTLLFVALTVIMIGVFAAPVIARDGDRYGGDNRHYKHDRHYKHGKPYRPKVYAPPGYYYYQPPPPPPVVYTPPPPPPGITFIFPLRIR